MTNWNMEENKKLYQTSTQHGSQERMQSFQNSMVVLWSTMGKLFHPAWTKRNGELGSRQFQDWTVELERYGSAGVLRGIESVREAGSDFVPKLNKFIGHCQQTYTGSNSTALENGSEQFHGSKLKSTPHGTPLVHTVGSYTHEQLMESPCDEDRNMAAQTGGGGWSHPNV